MKSRNLVIVIVDIAGFTERTGRQSRQESEAWLRRYEELLLPLVRVFGVRRVKRGDIFGEPVNITARVEGLAPSGEVWFTEAVYLAMTKSEVPAKDRRAEPGQAQGSPRPGRRHRRHRSREVARQPGIRNYYYC